MQFGKQTIVTEAARLAELIVHAKPVKIVFESEQQFLQLLGKTASDAVPDPHA